MESPAKGQRFELGGFPRRYGWADPRNTRCRKNRTPSSFSGDRAPASTDQTFGAVSGANACGPPSTSSSRTRFPLRADTIITQRCEGAGELFGVATLDLLNVRSKAGPSLSKDFFRPEDGLTVTASGGELLATALDGYIPSGRPSARRIRTPPASLRVLDDRARDAFAELADDIALAEGFIKHIIRRCLERCPEDMAFFNDRIQKGVIDMLEGVAAARFEVISYTEAVDIHGKSGEKFEYTVAWGDDLQSEHERYITEKKFRSRSWSWTTPEDQGVLYAAERRRKNGARHGRPRAPYRRDHRRERARKPVRCFD